MNRSSAIMMAALIFLLLVALSQAGVPNHGNPSVRIVNGEEVGDGEIPYQVSLQFDDDFHYCGGSILNENYVITSAYCVEGKSLKDVQIMAGSVDLDHSKSIHHPVSIIIHDRYNKSGFFSVNNIALIKVDVPFVVSETVDYVPLPKSGEDVPTGSVAVTSGWGWLSTKGPIPRKLHRKEVSVIAPSHCSAVYEGIGWTVRDTHICADIPKVANGPCIGDSGTPLTVGGKLVGVTFWDQGCGRRDLPTVYTRVSKYIDWIHKHAV